ncbi:hypothetical protein E3C22_15090 [Jiella endophytica]|uniref:Nucleotide-diphospho-sugar transferase domain-containing protein n=1 Tax=Jiella endophytica TaxID=2558362 RepID=A0A4Y8RGT7_9HYPH|nr:DUF6492 family protein [Jiella endophytica]TFF21973.1 hypothetical protein E3C22_15090 [Jiella endophytica]
MPTAIATASYRGDFERCRLLCESMDARVTGQTRHLILVESADVPLFRQLAGPKREIVDERELLPFWLRAFPDPTNFGRRRVWLSPFGLPLRGWHVQQLRRIALAATLDEAVMVSIDSDVVFLRDFDVSTFSPAGRTLFFRRPDAMGDVLDEHRDEHLVWSKKAGDLLGIETPKTTDTGYVATLIPWRTAAVRAMTKRIADVSGRSWEAALAATRALSECTIYGRFVDEVEGRPELYEPTDASLCQMYWSGAPMDRDTLARFVGSLAPGQVAAGIQSFTATDPGFIRQAAGLG